MTMIVTLDKFIENVTDAISAHKKAPFREFTFMTINFKDSNLQFLDYKTCKL